MRKVLAAALSLASISAHAATVSSLSPNTGPIAGGTTVAVTGTGFTNVLAVMFGPVPAASYTVNSTTSITAVAPAEAVGTINVRVIVQTESATGAGNRYTFTSTTAINGACGAANGVAVSAAPTANLCSAGTASGVNGSGPWSWTCLGSGGGTTAACTAPTTSTPPVGPIPPTAARPSYNTGNGYYVVGRGIYDPNGNLFTPIGFDKLHYDSPDPDRFLAKPNIERKVLYGPFGENVATTNQLMQEDLSNNTVPMPVRFDSDLADNKSISGTTDLATLNAAVNLWVSQAATWLPYNSSAWFNIANEWGPADDDSDAINFQNGYITAVGTLRQAGYTAPLVIDAGGSGEDYLMITKYAQAIENADPLHNVIFSVHVYGWFYNSVSTWQPASFQLGTAMAALAQLNVPVIIGEFGPGNVGPSTSDVTGPEVMQLAEQYQFGWLAWAWDDNDLANAQCDQNWFCLSLDGTYANLSNWGNTVVHDPNLGIQAVAKPSTVFP